MSTLTFRLTFRDNLPKFNQQYSTMRTKAARGKTLDSICQTCQSSQARLLQRDKRAGGNDRHPQRFINPGQLAIYPAQGWQRRRCRASYRQQLICAWGRIAGRHHNHRCPTEGETAQNVEWSYRITWSPREVERDLRTVVQRKACAGPLLGVVNNTDT